MAVPLRYNLRNLRVRWRTTLGTVVGIGLVVCVFLVVMALARGLQSTFVETGDPRNLLVLRKGSTAESSSQITLDEVRRIRYRDEIARDAAGTPLASTEILVLINLQRRGQPGTANVLVRGLEAAGFALRTKLHLVQGRMFQTGMRECIVSRKVAERFTNCQIGQQFRTGKTLWTVTGIFEAQRTAFESEIWTDANEAREVFKRDFYGSILIRPADPAVTELLNERDRWDAQLRALEDKQKELRNKESALLQRPASAWRQLRLAWCRWQMPQLGPTRASFEQLNAQVARTFVGEIERDKLLSVRVLTEKLYYEEQTRTSTKPIQMFGSFLAIVMSVGAAFAAMNTMYAAVGGRSQEIGTLRVLGFRRREIYVSFLLESIFLAGLGGLFGCAVALLWNGVSTGTMSFTTFSEVAFEFRVTPDLALQGMVFALIMGVVGGLLPARMAARKPVLDALRSV